MTWPADAVLACTLAEGLLLLLLSRSGRIRLPPRAIVSVLLPGVFLLVALRLALGGSGVWPVCAALLAAGGSHLLDLLQRLKGND
jgi:hypothetical protein